jgi:uncharacterized protein YdiU (UPF0061 family)
LQHSYAQLPEIFHAEWSPVPVREPRIGLFNRPLAESLGLDAQVLDSDEGAAVFGGNQLPDCARPLAMAYAGHQFGQFTTLGDGRAILLGEQIAPSGERFDVQLKGSGPTPFSRGGDGRAPLGPMLREFIISEAMHGLGIPTTRSLAVVTTGETVFRTEALPGAVLTRVAQSHIRVGTFEWAAAQRNFLALQALADHTLRRHYPEQASAAESHRALLDAVIERQAALVAQWMLVGFVHGVMNTDNTTLCGETIDYGPCAFLDTYEFGTVFSSIDHQARYAYGNQPSITHWNLARLAEAMLPLLDPDRTRAVDQANEAIGSFEAAFHRHWLAGMRAKLGLEGGESGDADDAADTALIQSLLEWMQRTSADFTNTFRALDPATDAEDARLADPEFAQWYGRWQARLERQSPPRDAVAKSMRAVNPAVIARNHQVEAALAAATLAAATQQHDLEPAQRLLAALSNPYDTAHDGSDFTAPPADGGHRYQTY